MLSCLATSVNNPALSVRAQQDLDLIQLALKGQANAYEELVRRYQKPLYHVVLKMVSKADDADDLTIEAFAKAFHSLPKYRPEYAFSTWLFRIATNHCIDFIRRKKVKTQSLDAGINLSDGESLEMETPDQALDPQDAFIRQQRIDLVRRAVTLMPPKYAKLIELRYFNELSYEEVADELGAPLGTIKAQLFRARELMLELVKGCYPAF